MKNTSGTPSQHLRHARLLAAALGLSIACSAHAGGWFFYKYTSMADSAGGFPFEFFVGDPAINSDAEIVFHGFLTGGVEGVFTVKTPGSINTLIDGATSPYNLGFGPSYSITDSGQVSFIGQSTGSDSTVTTEIRAQGHTSTALVDSPYHLSDYCGTQINANGSVASLATREDGGHAIIVQGGGPLVSVIRAVAVDKPNTDMDQAIVVASLNCAPSINNDGMVAFTGIKTDKFSGVFTGDSEGNFTEIVGADSTFAGFGGVTLNESGSINKVGMVLFQAFLQSGDEALYLWQPTSPTSSSLTKIADASALHGITFPGFAMDYKGQVAYELILDEFGSSAVYRGPGNIYGRVAGPGDVLFGRTVAAAHIDRGSINFNDQLAVFLDFTDGSQMIARGDPTSRFAELGFPVGALRATTGRGSSVSATTPVSTPSGFLTLSFDLTFLAGGGALEVKLGDATVKTIPAEELGVQRHISIPMDLRKTSKNPSPLAARVGSSRTLQFLLSGKPGLSAQIADVKIPGVFSESFQSQSLSRWQIKGTGGGTASVVSASRLPVNIRIEPQNHADKSGAHRVSVSISGGEGIDVTKDLQRATLRLAGTAPLTKKDGTGHEVPSCEAKDKAKELVCQFELKGLSAKNLDPTLSLEAATSFGWGITGTARAHLK